MIGVFTSTVEEAGYEFREPETSKPSV